MQSSSADQPGGRANEFERTIVRDCDPAAFADSRLMVMAACDLAYLENALTLIRSLDRMSPGHDFMLHVVNPGPDTMVELEQFALGLGATRLFLSAEKVRVGSPVLKRPYFACARFIRLADFIGCTDVPFLVMDADGLFVAPIDMNFSDKPEAEICLRRRDLEGAVEEELKIAAGAVWVQPNENTTRFFEAARDDLLAEFRAETAEWFVDQKILARHMERGTGNAVVRNIKAKYADWTFGDDAIIWTGKGNRKHFDVRYLLLRLSFDADPERRIRARSLLRELVALTPPDSRGLVGARILAALGERGAARIAIYLPRLDLPWKFTGMGKGGPPPPSEDTVELRLWWKRFTMELARMITLSGAEATLIEIPAWEITPARVDEDGHDLAFIPHRCHLDFERRDTPVMFYMQEYFRPVFVVDPEGWSAASSIYPVDASALPPAVLGAWDDYRARFRSGVLASKFSQSPGGSREKLVAEGLLPSRPYAFFPLQIPHDQSLTYFSDIAEADALDAVVTWAAAEGITLVLKEHPANRASTAAFRARHSGPGVFWSDAHVHDLIRHAKGVITLNSGVGFEALIVGRPLVTLARAEYDAAGFQAKPATLAQAWRDALLEDEGVRLTRYARFVDWFLARHAVDLSRPQAARYRLERIVSRALSVATSRRGHA